MSEAEHSILFNFMDFLYGMGGMGQICIAEMGQFAPGKKNYVECPKVMPLEMKITGWWLHFMRAVSVRLWQRVR